MTTVARSDAGQGCGGDEDDERVVGVRVAGAYADVLLSRLADPSRLDALAQAPWQGAWRDRARVLVRLAAQMLGVDIAEVNLVSDRLMECVASAADDERVLPVRESFCQHVVGTGGAVVVYDSLTSPLLAGHPSAAVARSYLGLPLTSHGQVLGALCVVGEQPHRWTDVEVCLLTELADALMEGEGWVA